MREQLVTTNRPDFVDVNLRNSDTVTIPKGSPVILNLSSAAQPTTGSDGFGPGFEDGLQVVLPATAGASPTNNFAFGIVLADVLQSQLGTCRANGIAPFSLVVRATRAASTNSWTSSASSSVAGGMLLSIDTVNNCFGTYVSTASLWQPYQGNLVLLDSMNSFSASASATSDTRTAALIGYRVFVRMM